MGPHNCKSGLEHMNERNMNKNISLRFTDELLVCARRKERDSKRSKSNVGTRSKGKRDE
jgi:hypothetical protein